MDRLFLWDGECYANNFVMTVHSVQKANLVLSAGDVIRILMFAVHRSTKGIISITKFEIIQNCPNIVSTPLCVQTLPQPLTEEGFKRYMQLAVPRHQPSPESTLSSSSLDWRSSLNQSITDPSSSSTTTPALPPVTTDFRSMHPIGTFVSSFSLPDFALRYAFQYPAYRDDQRDIIAAAMACRDVFVLKCTGGGKSLCFQVPAILSKGVTIVFCPLLSLLQDQIQSLMKRPCGGIPCAYLSGDCVRMMQRSHSQPTAVKTKVYQELEANSVNSQPCFKLLYLTPELFILNSRLQNLLHSLHANVTEIPPIYGIGQSGPFRHRRGALH